MQREVGSGLRGHNSVVVIAGGIVGEVQQQIGVVVACGALQGWVCAVAVPITVRCVGWFAVGSHVRVGGDI